MRRSGALVATGVLILASLVATPAAAKPGDEPTPAERKALSQGLQIAPKQKGGKPAGPNPAVSLLPNPAKADYAGWQAYLDAQAKQRADKKAADRARSRAVEPTPLLVDEDEPVGTRGSNDTVGTAQRAPGFGTAAGRNPKARIIGDLSPQQVSPTTVAPSTEDDGAIPLARDTGVDGGEGIRTTGTIGDGPHGSAGTGTGDFDYYKFHGVAGQGVTVDIDTPAGGTLDSLIFVLRADGSVVASNDDEVPGQVFDSKVTFNVPETADYFILTTGYLSLPQDVNDPASGTGADSEGPYTITITQFQNDVDFFAVNLRKGDVLGASVEGSASVITVWDRNGREVHGSDQDATANYPISTPLPGGGNAVTDHVAAEDGLHYISVTAGSGRYDITVEAYRPFLQGQTPTQTLFLDFNGARVNTAIFFGIGAGQRNLTGFPAFIGQWGLNRNQERALIRQITAEVEENLREDLRASGLNNRFRLRVLNSFDHADPWGQPNVSRVIIGGTIAESGIDTIGIAQSIDPGNFTTEETALVLLDILSSNDGHPASLNTYMTGASNRVKFVSQAIGNVVSHEAGHFFGNWHVDQFNDQPNLMDQGGNFPVMFGVGPDGIGGTADDPDVDFGEDEFNPNEGFTGIENTLARPAFGLTS